MATKDQAQAQEQITNQAYLGGYSNMNVSSTNIYSAVPFTQSSGASTAEVLGIGSTGYSNINDGYYKVTMIRTDVFPDKIEILYKIKSVLSNGVDLPLEDVYKIVHSCVDGKWNVSEPIFGDIYPATEEDYIFNGLKA